MSYNLLRSVHKDLPVPENGQTFLIKGNYDYWHYDCDNFNDKGWGCGYRTLQTICSWFNYNRHMDNNEEKRVPTINKIQRIIDEVGDKNTTFIATKNWIGTFEAFLVLNHLYNASCKIIHVWKGTELRAQVDTIKGHFLIYGSPIMMGGDKDCSSKCIVGIHTGERNTYLLIVDPHFVGKAKSMEDLKKRNWIKWQKLDDFDDSSFYNLCLPQVSCDTKK